MGDQAIAGERSGADFAPPPQRVGCGSGRARGPLAALSVLLALVLGTGCMTTAPPPPGAPSEAYRIGPPDLLLIRVLPEPVVEQEVTVRPDGMVSVELIGDVRAEGRTPEEVAAEISERIQRFKRNANVTVTVASALSPTVVLFGEVRSPGVFPLARATRVAEAIGQQGGTTIFAAKGGISVIRTDGKDTVVHEVDLAAIQRGDLRTNILLAEGDIIVVPPTVFAKVGYFLQTLLFPFQQVGGAVGTAAGAAIAFGN